MSGVIHKENLQSSSLTTPKRWEEKSYSYVFMRQLKYVEIIRHQWKSPSSPRMKQIINNPSLTLNKKLLWNLFSFPVHIWSLSCFFLNSVERTFLPETFFGLAPSSLWLCLWNQAGGKPGQASCSCSQRQACRFDTIWGLDRNAESQAPPQSCLRIKIP